MKIQEDKGLTMENIFSQEKVIVIDFGGQYNQLVARRVRECNVYCEIYSYRTDIEQIKAATSRIHQPIPKNYLNLAFRFWDFAMVHS